VLYAICGHLATSPVMEGKPTRYSVDAPTSAWESISDEVGVKLDGYGVAISELETELDYLRRAKRYLKE
jgi:hypothetical protein